MQLVEWSLSADPADEIQKERRDSLEVLVVPFERPCWPVEICVRQLRVAVLPSKSELSLLGCFLAALLGCFLSTLFR